VKTKSVVLLLAGILSATFVSAQTQIIITTPSVMPTATAFESYGVQLTATGGTLIYTWSVANVSSLPSGMSLSVSGYLSGIPTAAGSGTFNQTTLPYQP
jgi:hypothetical protein